MTTTIWQTLAAVVISVAVTLALAWAVDRCQQPTMEPATPTMYDHRQGDRYDALDSIRDRRDALRQQLDRLDAGDAAD